MGIDWSSTLRYSETDRSDEGIRTDDGRGVKGHHWRSVQWSSGWGNCNREYQHLWHWIKSCQGRANDYSRDEEDQWNKNYCRCLWGSKTACATINEYINDRIKLGRPDQRVSSKRASCCRGACRSEPKSCPCPDCSIGFRIRNFGRLKSGGRCDTIASDCLSPSSSIKGWKVHEYGDIQIRLGIFKLVNSTPQR